MNRNTQSLGRTETELTPVLIKLAALSALLRLQRQANLAGCVAGKRGEGEDRRIRRAMSLRLAMTELGDRCRRLRQDARESPLWALLEHRECYAAAYENHRAVVLGELTPRAIYDGVSRGNHLYWHGWQIYRGDSQEITDEYGCPGWGALVWLRTPKGALSNYEGVSRHNAREIYRDMTGSSYTGEDRLGIDPPHPAERIPWYVTGEGSGLWPFDPAMLPVRVGRDSHAGHSTASSPEGH